MNNKLSFKQSIIGLSLFLLILAGCTALDGQPATSEAEPESPASSDPLVSPEEAVSDDVSQEVVNMEEPTVKNEAVLTYQTMPLANDTSVDFALLLPENFDPQQNYPILLAMPPGGQTQDMVAAGLNGYWAEEAAQRGWIVVSPAAPGGRLFFQGSENVIPEFLDLIAAQYPPENGKFHLAGISNGGISAFRIALENPDRFHSLLVLPGFPRGEEDFQRLDALIGLPVMMFVGENDTSWISGMEATAEALTDLGGTVSLDIVPGEGHVIQSLTGEELFDLLDDHRG